MTLNEAFNLALQDETYNNLFKVTQKLCIEYNSKNTSDFRKNEIGKELHLIYLARADRAEELDITKVSEDDKTFVNIWKYCQ